jgi:hypothetical protein
MQVLIDLTKELMQFALMTGAFSLLFAFLYSLPYVMFGLQVNHVLRKVVRVV